LHFLKVLEFGTCTACQQFKGTAAQMYKSVVHSPVKQCYFGTQPMNKMSWVLTSTWWM